MVKEKISEHAGQRSAGADHQFENVAQVAGEKDEGEDRRRR